MDDEVLSPIESLPDFERHKAVSELSEVSRVHLPGFKIGRKPSTLLFGPERANLSKVLPLGLESGV